MATATGTTRTAPARHSEAKRKRVPRTTGAVSGLLIVVLGVWGGLIPFIGPSFHYAFGGYQTWHFTSQRLWLDIIPGAVAVIGGLLLMRASTRSGGLIGGWMALAAGAWFAVGPAVSILWHDTIYAIGAPMGSHTRQMLEWIGYFSGLGVVIVGLAAFAMGRYFSRPRLAEEPAVAAEETAADRRDRPVADEPVEADERTADGRTTDGRTTDGRTADGRTTDERIADERIADRRVGAGRRAEEPVAEEPVADRPTAD